MPTYNNIEKHMPDYKNSKIYKIESLTGGVCYIGSTTQTLSMRMCGHRADYKSSLDGKSKITSTKVLCYDDAKIYLIESYPCNTREELHAKEGEWIKKVDCVNKNIPCRPPKKYYEDNKEYLKFRSSIYRQKNTDRLKKKRKEYKKNNSDKIRAYENKPYICDCGTTVKFGSKSSHIRSKNHLKIMSKKVE